MCNFGENKIIAFGRIHKNSGLVFDLALFFLMKVVKHLRVIFEHFDQLFGLWRGCVPIVDFFDVNFCQTH